MLLMNQTPFDASVTETLKIRRPDARATFGMDIRGQFAGKVAMWRFGLDDNFGINLSDVFYRIRIEEALPLRPLTDTTDPNYDRDVQDNDHLIRLKFYTADELDTSKKQKQAKRKILQIVNIEAYQDLGAMLLICKELGTL